MRVSLNALRIATHPHVTALMVGLIRNDARRNVGAVPADMVDNSTGANQVGGLVPIPTLNKFTYAGGATLAPRAAFNTASGKIDDAIAVLADFLNDEALEPIGAGVVVQNATSNIAVAGTIPALDKALAGVDGSGNTALLRSEANAAISVHRNNFATVVRAYNAIATALGAPTLNDASGGKPSLDTYTLVNEVPAATAVGSASDVVSDAEVDATLTAIANNVATLANRINNVLFTTANVTPTAITLVA